MRDSGLAALLAASIAACAATPLLPTHSFSNAGGLLFEGELRISGGCSRLVTENEAINLVWPPGFAFRGDPIEIRGPLDIVLRDGDAVALGAFPPEPGVVSGCPPGLLAYVGEVAEVNGVRVPQVPPPSSRPGPLVR